MARSTKEERAAYMREYRAKRAARQSTLGYVEVQTSLHSVAPKPTFLAAPVDECPLCSHDRQESDHIGGRACKFKTSPRRSCGCSFEGF